MKKLRKVVILIAAALLWIQSNDAQGLSLPKEAQEAVGKAAALESYRVRFTIEAKDEGGEFVKLEGTLLYQKPNHRRLELKRVETGEVEGLLVSDGKMEWQYSPAENVVYRVTNVPEAPGPHRPFAETQLETLRFVERTGNDAEERLRFEATPLPALSEGAPVPIQTLRVDVGAKDGLVRELALLDDKGEVVFQQRYRNVEVNVPITSGDFLFTPPKGVGVVDVGEPPKGTE